MDSNPSPHQPNKIFAEFPVKILAGNNKATYYIHPGLLKSSGSKAFTTRLTGPWQQAGENKPLDWTDFDEQTVECVLEYLYTHDYSTPNSSVERESCPEEETKCEDKGIAKEDGQSSVPEMSPYDKALLERPLTPLVTCIDASLPTKSRPTAAGTLDEAVGNDKLGAEILIHSKVYAFAQYFMLPKLEDLALQRLTQSLSLVHEKEIQSLFPCLADAIGLVYHSTPSAKIKKDRARKLLSQFVALRYTELWGEGLDTLLAEGGDFTSDVTQCLARQLLTTSVSAKALQTSRDWYKGQHDHLQNLSDKQQDQIKKGEDQIKKTEKELKEWQSWNRAARG